MIAGNEVVWKGVREEVGGICEFNEWSREWSSLSRDEGVAAIRGEVAKEGVLKAGSSSEKSSSSSSCICRYFERV